MRDLLSISESASLPPLFLEIVSMLATAGLMFLAFLEFQRLAYRPRKVGIIVVLYAGAIAAIYLLGAFWIFAKGLLSGGSLSGVLALCGATLLLGLYQVLLSAIFLGGALGTGMRGGPLKTPRLLPEADRWLLRRRIKRGEGRKRGRRLPRRSWPALGECALWFAVMVLFSPLWLHVAQRYFGAQIAPELAEGLVPSEDTLQSALFLQLFLFIVMAPFFEEVLFRGFLQDYLLRFWRGRLKSPVLPIALSVLITSALWALRHNGQIEPGWVKWVQIFGIGIPLGIVRIRHGLEACILLHLLFNVFGSQIFSTGF